MGNAVGDGDGTGAGAPISLNWVCAVMLINLLLLLVRLEESLETQWVHTYFKRQTELESGHGRVCLGWLLFKTSSLLN